MSIEQRLDYEYLILVSPNFVLKLKQKELENPFSAENFLYV